VKGGHHQVTIGYHPASGNRVLMVASRFVFEMMHGGSLPAGIEVGHLCNNPGCIKPSHLAGMTRAQNEAMKHSHRMAYDRRRTTTAGR
jgi:hypothetical protein